MKRTKLLISLLVLLTAAGSLFAGGGSQAAPAGGGATASPAASAVPASGSLPRNETFYMNGILWGKCTQFNPYGTGGTSFGIAAGPNARQLIYETLFLYNFMDMKVYPNIGESFAWNGQTLTVKLRRDVTFNNGQALTAADVVHSFKIHQEYQTSSSGIWGYLADVVAKDDYTVDFVANPNRFNRGYLMDTVCGRYISSKANWDEILKTADPARGTAQSNRMAVAQFPNLEPVATGAYKPMLTDETKTVLVRNDNYWGKAKYGKLPAPRYVVHNVFKDNAAGDEAFRAGEVDVSQQFINQVWLMWQGGAKVSTYLPQLPYYLPGVLTTICFNSKKPGLDDPVVRRAIGMSLDFESIGTNASSGYTAPVQASFMLPTPLEQAMVDLEALKPYQWPADRPGAIAQANRELDAAGWVKGADGIRAKGGVKLSFIAECPMGWSDSMAIFEIVAATGKEIGIDIKTNFPTAATVQEHKDNTTFDIINHNYGGAGPSTPWDRFYSAMGSSDMPADGVPNNVQNWGRWRNDEVNTLIDQAAAETDPAKLKQIYTRLNVIYLQNMPVAITRYRPLTFHTVNASVWEGFPKMGDGSNIPPTLCTDGYGYTALFNLTAVAR